ncbi:MAG: hypothetical protein NWE89_14190 [Candidatus Bathyarchaeota archaeon]|nr:hypothetical protein [Candidatus Bathyarchaeota archaeon]
MEDCGNRNKAREHYRRRKQTGHEIAARKV